jgi:UPF0716 protein FxsA
VAVFALLFIVLPLVEIYVAVQVAHVIGGWETLLLLAAISIAGLYVTKLAGFGALRNVRRDVARGEMPTNSLLDGLMALLGGLLLIVPGFVTAAAGVLLLFPPTRVLARNQAKRHFVGRVTYIDGSPPSPYLDGPDDVIDV